MKRNVVGMVGVLMAGFCVCANGAEEDFHHTYPLRAKGKVSIENVNGNVTISTWDKQEVEVRATTTSAGTNGRDSARVEVKSKPGAVRIATKLTRNTRGDFKEYSSPSVTYVVHVPQDAVIESIDAVNGNVSVTGAAAVKKVRTVNGSVAVTFGDAHGAKFAGSNLSTVNGRMDIKVPSDGNLTIDATSRAGVKAEVGTLQTEGQKISGKVGSSGATLNAKSVNGHIRISGT